MCIYSHYMFYASVFFFFFFSSRRRHTRFDCDWSSDVCSSDLLPEVDQEVHEVHLAPRPLGEAPELGELLRELVQPLGLGANDFHCHVRPPFHRTARPPQLVYRDAHGGERILDLVRDAARHLAERPQALRLELALARGVERRRELPQGLAQRFEFPSAAARRGPPQ